MFIFYFSIIIIQVAQFHSAESDVIAIYRKKLLFFTTDIGKNFSNRLLNLYISIAVHLQQLGDVYLTNEHCNLLRIYSVSRVLI